MDNKLEKLLLNLNMDKEDIKGYSFLKLEKVVIKKKENILNIFLSSLKIIPFELYEKLYTLLLSSFSNAKNVVVYVDVAEVDYDLMSEYYSILVGHLNINEITKEQFRGFSISDVYAPLIFINGADTKAAQIFTLAHEVAHIWLGVSGVTDTQLSSFSNNKIERWCNAVAAEILVPEVLIRKEFNRDNELKTELNRLAKFYKVSTLVILRRIFDIGAISKDEFWILFKTELERLKSFKKKGGGGDFYKTQKFRVSANFARALLVSTLEGRTLHRDAFKLLGFSKLSTFRELGSFYGVGI